MHPRKGRPAGYLPYTPDIATQPAVVISYWSVLTLLSSLFLMGGLYFSFRISLEVSRVYVVCRYVGLCRRYILFIYLSKL